MPQEPGPASHTAPPPRSPKPRIRNAGESGAGVSPFALKLEIGGPAPPPPWALGWPEPPPRGGDTLEPRLGPAGCEESRMKPRAVGSLSSLPQKRNSACQGSFAPPEQLPHVGGGTLVSSPTCDKWGLRSAQKGSLQVTGRAAEASPILSLGPRRASSRPSSGKPRSCGALWGEAGFSGCLPPPACLPSPKTPWEPRVLLSTPARPVSLIPRSDTCQRWPRPRSRSAGSPPGTAQQCHWVTTPHDLLTLSCILSLMG